MNEGEVHQYVLNGECKNGDIRFPGGNSGTIDQCLGGGEGMYFVPDKKLGVNDCLLADEFWTETYSPTPSLHKPKYFADSWNMVCRTGSKNGAYCVDEIGCTDCIQDNIQSSSVYYLFEIDGFGEGTEGSEFDTGCTLGDKSGNCLARDSTTLETKDPGSDPNGKSGNIYANVCEAGNQGFVLENNEGIQMQGIDANGLDGSLNNMEGSQCQLGFYLTTSNTGSSGSTNGAECESVSTGTLGYDDFVLSDSGKGNQEGESNEYVGLTTYNPPIQGKLYNSKSGKTKQGHSTGAQCLDNQNSDDKGIDGNLGYYLSIIDQDSLSGYCKLKEPKSDNNENLVFISNSLADYETDISIQDGSKEHPFINLMTALSAVPYILSQYNSTADGSNLKIRIAMYAGDHYVIRNNDLKYLKQKYNSSDSSSLNYKVIISPYYGDLDGYIDTEHGVEQAPTTYDDAPINVYVKIGQNFKIKLPEEFEIEGVNFDFTDSIIPFEDDQDLGTTSRRKGCQVDDESIITLRYTF